MSRQDAGAGRRLAEAGNGRAAAVDQDEAEFNGLETRTAGPRVGGNPDPGISAGATMGARRGE
ncbi:MAG TPA: hypothetical protein VFQ27_12750 [Xanthobacteraceae bacterium]|nr:hypothetical protein [Xanthobacteraceae bacterium]